MPRPSQPLSVSLMPSVSCVRPVPKAALHHGLRVLSNGHAACTHRPTAQVSCFALLGADRNASAASLGGLELCIKQLLSSGSTFAHGVGVERLKSQREADAAALPVSFKELGLVRTQDDWPVPDERRQSCLKERDGRLLWTRVDAALSPAVGCIVLSQVNIARQKRQRAEGSSVLRARCIEQMSQDPALMGIWARRNWADIALYDFAAELLAERQRTAHHPRPSLGALAW